MEVMLKPAVFVLLALALAPADAQKKSGQSKPPEIEVIEITVRRQEGNITADGKVRNCGEKPIKSLNILFDFLDSDRSPLTTQRAIIEEEVLAPGDEAEFHAQVPEPPRATHFRVNFEDGGGKWLRPKKEEVIRPIE
jgi:hypothetical protein